MTVKEIAEFTGKTERAVKQWVKKCNENISLHNEDISLSADKMSPVGEKSSPGCEKMSGIPYENISQANCKMQLQKGHETDYTLSEVQAILIAGGMSEMQVSALMQTHFQKT